MSDVIQSSTNFLVTLSETVGPIGAVFIFLGIIAILVGATATIYYIKNKSTKSIVNKEIERVLDKIDDSSEEMTVILDLIRNIANAILSINKKIKIKYTLSDKDAVTVLRLVTTGNLLLDVVTQSMIFSADIKDRNDDTTELRSQFILELKIKWTDYLDSLNSFKAPLRIGDFVDKNFNLEFFNDDIIESDYGVLHKITNVVFNQNIEISVKYSRIKTVFSNFSQKVIHSLEEELAKIMNGGE